MGNLFGRNRLRLIKEKLKRLEYVILKELVIQAILLKRDFELRILHFKLGVARLKIRYLNLKLCYLRLRRRKLLADRLKLVVTQRNSFVLNGPRSHIPNDVSDSFKHTAPNDQDQPPNEERSAGKTC